MSPSTVSLTPRKYSCALSKSITSSSYIVFLSQARVASPDDISVASLVPFGPVAETFVSQNATRRGGDGNERPPSDVTWTLPGYPYYSLNVLRTDIRAGRPGPLGRTSRKTV